MCPNIIIGVNKGNVFSITICNTGVSCICLSLVLYLKKFNSFVLLLVYFTNLSALVCGPVINQNQFNIIIGLFYNTFDAFFKEFFCIINGNNNA